LAFILTYLVLFETGMDAAQWSTNLIFMCFISAIGMVFLQGWFEKFLLLCAAFIMGFLFSRYEGFRLFFGMYLPTLIHVFIFTGLFILLGALKNKSATGIASIVVFVLCGASFFFYKPILSWYHVSDYAVNNVHNIQFDGLVYAVVHMLHLDVKAYKDVYHVVFQSMPGQSVMRFIAFAYTYHYLNWFSKTSVIKWHLVPRKWLIVVIVSWLAAVGIYAVDYMLGLEVLFLLSMLHVFLEFPLNYRSFIGIAEELGVKIKTPSPIVATAPAAAPAPVVKKIKKGK